MKIAFREMDCLLTIRFSSFFRFKTAHKILSNYIRFLRKWIKKMAKKVRNIERMSELNGRGKGAWG